MALSLFEHFTHAISLILTMTLLLPVLRMGKLRHGVVNELVQGHSLPGAQLRPEPKLTLDPAVTAVLSGHDFYF